MTRSPCIRSFARILALTIPICFAAPALAQSTYSDPDGTTVATGHNKPTKRITTECYAAGEVVRPSGATCPGVALRCEDADCVATFDGAARRIIVGPQSSAAPPGLPPGGGGGPGPFGEPVLQDPFCAWMEAHDQECPPPPNPGGGTGPIDTSHQGELDCTLCSIRYTACFASCSVAWYPGCFTRCTTRFIDCARANCDDQ